MDFTLGLWMYGNASKFTTRMWHKRIKAEKSQLSRHMSREGSTPTLLGQ